MTASDNSYALFCPQGEKEFVYKPVKSKKESMNTTKLSFKTKLSYGMGDIYGGGATTLISMYYMTIG